MTYKLPPETMDASRRLEANAGEGSTQSHPVRYPGHPHRRALRVLIVDDEEELADSLCTTITSWGHSTHRLYDGASGLIAAGDQAPNVVLLDIAMPGMDGYEFARQLRLRTELQGCYLIAMRSTDDVRGGARRESTIDLFLAKPMNLSVLETLLLMEGERLDRLS